jgi:hypothetical protein
MCHSCTCASTELRLLLLTHFIAAQIDMRGNPLMGCPDNSTVSNNVAVLCDSKAADASVASQAPQARAARSDAGDRKLSAASIAAICGSLLALIALLAAGIYCYKRRQSKGDGAYEHYGDSHAIGTLPQEGVVDTQRNGTQPASFNLEKV